MVSDVGSDGRDLVGLRPALACRSHARDRQVLHSGPRPLNQGLMRQDCTGDGGILRLKLTNPPPLGHNKGPIALQKTSFFGDKNGVFG